MSYMSENIYNFLNLGVSGYNNTYGAKFGHRIAQIQFQSGLMCFFIRLILCRLWLFLMKNEYFIRARSKSMLTRRRSVISAIANAFVLARISFQCSRERVVM